ncbi:MAG TPA: penicillin acylase family protein [Candidatus Acidoferrum sp.]|nr:penicillin acylase family protein [Candidatus Acidoferrum sp.]
MTRTSRLLRNLLAALLVLLGLALLLAWWTVRRALPTLDGSVSVPGLKQGVIVDRDQWGRPWIRANSVDDLVEAQGYVMAQDRLWQMDLIRRAAAGNLSEIFGEVALDADKENRTLGMREAAERAAADSSPEIRALLESYARGVNQYIAERGNRLPIEFVALRYKPRPWTLADTYLISLYMYKTLTTTWKAKLNRQWIVQQVGPERARDLFAKDSPLDHFIAAIEPIKYPVRFSGAAEAKLRESPATNGPPPFAPERWDAARAFLAQFGEETSEIIGSNNFVVSGAHTASGKPLLANDTHLGLGVPCIWYLVHMTAPGWNVEGFGLPGAPLVIIGHNDRIAWGFTNSNADVQDLYVETFDPMNALAYRVNGQWRSADVRRETIHVRGKPDVVLDVLVTRHGPIVHRDPPGEGGRAYALRWTALEPGGLDFGFPLLGRAKNWTEFVEVTRHIAGPGQNTIYADVDGNIGFTIPARIPIRANGNGALPVPGDTDDYEWKGYIPFEELPRVLDPPDGIIATANARTVGRAYKYYLSDRQAGPYRTERIYELLSGRRDLRAVDCNAVQNDVLSLPNKFLAGQLVAAAHVQEPKDARAKELIGRLSGWDARATTDSVETSFVEYTRHALFRNLLAPYLNRRVTDYELWEPESIYANVWWRDKVFLENTLRTRPPAWLPQGFASYNDLLIASADEAVAALEKQTRRGEISAWNWGSLHQLDMIHPLGRSGLLHHLFSIGPYESNGTIDTVRAMGRGHGPAMRFVSDLANFDDSLMEITTGESGEYASPYYRDQFPEWFAGRGIPAPFTDSAEEKVRAHRLFLLPPHATAAATH